MTCCTASRCHRSKHNWTWPVAPLGEESADYQIVHEVVATY